MTEIDQSQVQQPKGQTRAELEDARILKMALKRADRTDGPPMKLTLKGGELTIKFDHTDLAKAKMLLMADLGTCDVYFLSGALDQAAVIGAKGKAVDETNTNFLLSVVRAVQPKDELESMLALQMGAIHIATMAMARRLNHVDTIPQQDSAERALNKLARTYAVQMEALKRYRTGGQQKVIVEHVTVNWGGQAFVGVVGGAGS